MKESNQCSVNDADDAQDFIAAIVARKVGISRQHVKPKHRLLHDLGLYGDDAEEILESLVQKFAVDMSTFRFETYFFPEGFAFGLLPKMVQSRLAEQKKPITVSDLVVCARERRWCV